jgi:hypothetical protein
MLIFYGIVFWVYIFLSTLNGFDDNSEKSRESLQIVCVLLLLWATTHASLEFYAKFGSSSAVVTEEEIQDAGPAR